MVKTNEIGSEFPIQYMGNMQSKNKFVFLENINDIAYTFCGRTAIETVLNNEKNIKKILLPSYCCESMIEPFIKNNIEVNFYDVNYKNNFEYTIDIDGDTNALLWCNYFGFENSMPDFSAFLKHGGIIIEDITHSLLSKKVYNSQSQYLVGSLRKWGPLYCGGICVSLRKKLKYFPKNKPSIDFLELKRNAMIQKMHYLNDEEFIDKNVFLKMFSMSNRWLEENYSNLSMDDESLYNFQNFDFNNFKKIRKENANVLYEGLKDCKYVHFLFEKDKIDCPLFVPILVEPNERNKLREYLVNNNIFCPIHWPKPNSKCESNLYDMELSLVCDQRYNKFDMKRIVNVIKQYFI